MNSRMDARITRSALGWGLALSLGWVGLVGANGAVVHVSPGGKDGWNGGLAKPARDGTDGPVATPARALERVRELRQASGTNGLPVEVVFAPGWYELNKPLHVGPAEAGRGPGASLLLRGERPGAAVLDGGTRVKGWQRVPGKDGVWSARVDAGKVFRRLSVDGVTQPRARHPEQGFLQVDGAFPAEAPIEFRFRDGDLRAAWGGAGVELVGYQKWIDFHLPLLSVDEAARVARLPGRFVRDIVEPGARYYLENVREGLGRVGAWHLDAAGGVVTWNGGPGSDPNRQRVMAGRLPVLVEVRGDPDAKVPVRGVELRDLVFSGGDWEMGSNGVIDTQAAVAVPGVVRGEWAVGIKVRGCKVENVGGYGFELGRGCQGWEVVGNEVVEAGGGGIRVGETAVRWDAFEANHSHSITDNHFHRLGRVFAPAVGVFILQSGTNGVAHNHVHDLFYTAVSVGWTWGYQESPCRGNRIEFNHLHQIGQGLLSDMGAVYTLGPQPGTVVRNNVIHDVESHDYGGWGLYTDEGSTGILLEDNVVYRTKSAGFHQHYGKENVIRNNIFALGREFQLMRTRQEEHQSFTFEGNIIYWNSGQLLGSNWKGSGFRMRRNLYYDVRAGVDPEQYSLAGMSWKAWLSNGQDAGSLLGDPGFVNPEAGDFRLKKPGAGAGIGFHPIATDRVGVRTGWRSGLR